jgi:hypothetical protein
MLRERYGGSDYAYFDEVEFITDGAGGRRCDGIAMSLWPSRGLELHGFEIKVSRSDYLAELRDPDKAKAFKSHCDRWWLVARSRTIVKDDLPRGWGAMWPRGGRLVVSVGAPKLEPAPMPRGMLAGLLRRAAQGNADKATMEARYRAGVEAGKNQSSMRVSRAEKRLDVLSATVAAFQESSGINLATWDADGAELGAAVDCVLKMQGRFGAIGGLANTASAMARKAEELRSSLRDLVEHAKAAGIQGELPEIE